jgi:hypothetical protein
MEKTTKTKNKFLRNDTSPITSFITRRKWLLLGVSCFVFTFCLLHIPSNLGSGVYEILFLSSIGGGFARDGMDSVWFML